MADNRWVDTNANLIAKLWRWGAFPDSRDERGGINPPLEPDELALLRTVIANPVVEPPKGSVVLDGDGIMWIRFAARDEKRWQSGDSLTTWDSLSKNFGTLKVPTAWKELA